MNLYGSTKKELEVIAKQQGIKGDFARMSKDALIEKIIASGVVCTDAPAAAAVADADAPGFCPEPVTIDGECTVVATVEPAAQVIAPQAKRSDDKLREVLRDVFGTPEIDEARIRDIAIEVVERAKAGLPTKVQTIIVQPGKENVTVDGDVSATIKEMLTNVQANVNTLLVGPAGCGKTTMAAMLAKILGKRFVSISCQAGMSVSNFNGWLLPTGDGGKFEYVASEFVDAYEKGDAVILIDEIDAADSNMLLVINSALANGHMSIPQRYTNPTVKRGDGVVIIATANTFGKGGDLVYVGREALDTATMDRFLDGLIVVDYDAKFERANVNEMLVSFAKKVRGKMAELKIRRVLSTRVLMGLTRLMAAGKSFEEVIERYFITWSIDDRNKVW